MQIDIRSLLRQPGEVLAIKFGPDQANNSNKPNQTKQTTPISPTSSITLTSLTIHTNLATGFC